MRLRPFQLALFAAACGGPANPPPARPSRPPSVFELDAAQCEAAGDAESCAAAVSLAVEEGPSHEPGGPPFLERLCGRGSAAGCQALGTVRLQAGDRPKARTAYGQACTLADDASCEALGTMAFDDRDFDGAARWWSTVCARASEAAPKGSQACRELAKLHAEKRLSDADPSCEAPLRAYACSLDPAWCRNHDELRAAAGAPLPEPCLRRSP